LTAGPESNKGCPTSATLYSETEGQAAIRALIRAAHDRSGNLPLFPFF
jgi:hypothetical protein